MLIEAGIIGYSSDSVISMTRNGDIKSILIEGSPDEIIEQVITKYQELPVLVGTEAHNDIIFFTYDPDSGNDVTYIACSHQRYEDLMMDRDSGGIIRLMKSYMRKGGIVRILGKFRDKWFMNWLDENPLEVK